MRRLSTIESSFTQINLVYPLTLVCVLKMKVGPTEKALQSALDRLQILHPLLTAFIKEKKNKYWFEKDEAVNPIPLKLIPRKDDKQWQSVARNELNLGIDHTSSPLMRANYLVSNPALGESEIVLSIHHAITDGVSLLHMIHKLMSMAGADEMPKNISASKLKTPFTLAPSFKKVLPSDFRDLRLLYHLLPFMYRQIKEEQKYKKSTNQVKDSPIPPSSKNDLLTIDFSEEESLAIVKWTRYHKLTLNNAITAAMLKSVNRHKYADKKELLRAVQFANLRPYLRDSISNAQVGCFVALMRCSISLNKESSIAQVATQLDQQFIKSAKRGEKYLYALLGNTIVKKTIKAHNERLGAVALSYAGPIQLNERYGDIQMSGIHAFISNNCLGAELSGFGKFCFGKLSIDLNYLSAETNREQALALAEEIKTILLQLALKK